MAYDDVDRSRAVSLARARQPMSPLRQDESPIRSFGLIAGPSALAPPQPPGYGQLVAVRSGVALLGCRNVRMVLTRGHAVWIPDGTPYVLELRARSELRVLYADSGMFGRAFGPVRVSALLDELIERSIVSGYLDLSNARDARVLAVIDDELRDLAPDGAANALALPRDPALLATVGRVLASAGDVPSIAALATAACMSVRTFERHFMRETGLPPRQWLRRARLAHAAIALAAGATVTEAALASGYSSLSAFVAAYRIVFGITPGRAHLAPPRGDRLA